MGDFGLFHWDFKKESINRFPWHGFMLEFQVMANKSPHPRILASGKSREKTVCLSCVKEGYHAPRQGLLTGSGTGGVRRGREGKLREGGWGREKEREREREREREGSKAVEGRTPGGSWKKAGGKPGRREGEAEEKNGGRGRLAWLGITEGMRECLQDKKQRAVFVRRPVGNKVLALFYFPT